MTPRKSIGPLAVVHYCPACGFSVVVRRNQRLGRGSGFRDGNKARGQIIQHMKTCAAAINQRIWPTGVAYVEGD